MRVFHGSNSDFEKFEIRRGKGYLVEGPGVYMSNKETVASDYGEFLYVVEINDEDISDFTDKNYIISLYKHIADEVKVDFFEDINMECIIECILSGDGSVLDSPKEISDYIESYEYLYKKYEDLMEDLTDIIRKSFLNNIKDVIKYKSKDFQGDIYLCFRNPEKLKIIEKKNI